MKLKSNNRGILDEASKFKIDALIAEARLLGDLNTKEVIKTILASQFMVGNAERIHRRRAWARSVAFEKRCSCLADNSREGTPCIQCFIESDMTSDNTTTTVAILRGMGITLDDCDDVLHPQFCQHRFRVIILACALRAIYYSNDNITQPDEEAWELLLPSLEESIPDMPMVDQRKSNHLWASDHVVLNNLGLHPNPQEGADADCDFERRLHYVTSGGLCEMLDEMEIDFPV